MANYFFFLMVLIFSACSFMNKEETEKTESVVSFQDKQDTNPIPEETPADDLLREYGKVIRIEDVGYPRFVIQIDFPERQFHQDFGFNVEVSPLNMEQLHALDGQYIAFFYTSTLEKNLMDMHFKGKSVFGEYAPETLEGTKQITGVLSQADEPTPGDLPGEIHITPMDGNTLRFGYFVTQEMVDVNLKNVTVYYDERATHTIVEIVQ